ncbi:protein kinase domain-containing protein [Robertmurraya korlensis]|uniref:protein kinase domain-containing protein n=1 Tax=Robertmurraya korlensis TaxID=519977 RepID=UPI000826325C|nr:serine/threonine protein kinase [Robertmurraya korlensis]
MMNNTLKNLSNITPGTIVEGKWHKNRYVIVKELGYGANGIVYLAQHLNQYVALKLSHNGMSITSEVNVLKSFAKVQGSTLGPSLVDVDDWMRPSGKVSFYTMEYIKGPDFLTFIQQKGSVWIEVLVLQLLSDLHLLHINGWIFGDLKPENLIVTGPPSKIRCIDVGGTTIQGRAIKEFTEFYDRGYWGLGSRKADPTYDLFAVAMIIINTSYPKRFQKNSGGLNQLQMMIRQKPELHKFEQVIISALQGKYQTANEMREALINTDKTHTRPSAPKTSNTKSQQQHSKPVMQQQTRQAQTRAAQSRQTIVKKKKKRYALETMLIVTTLSFLYFLYIYGQL